MDMLDIMAAKQLAKTIQKGDKGDKGLKGDPGNGDLLAPDFSTSTAYKAGDYVIYDGKLYKFTAAHAAGAWDASQAEIATVAENLSLQSDEVINLKRALNSQGNTPFSNLNYIAMFESGKAVNFGSLSVGADVPMPYNTSNFRSLYASCTEGDVFTIKAVSTAGVGLWCFVDINRKLILRSTNKAFDASTPIVITAPAESAGLIVNILETNYLESYVVKTGAKYLYYDTLEALSERYTDKEINELSYYTSANVNKSSLWEQGHIKVTDGTNGASSATSYSVSIRTVDYLDSRIQSLYIIKNSMVRVFRYSHNNAFIDSKNYVDEQYVPLPVNYKYRIMIQHEGGPAITVQDAFSDVYFKSCINRYAREVAKGIVASLGSYYKGLGNQYNLFDRTATTASIYSEYNNIFANAASYANMETIGTASDGQNINKITLKPEMPDINNVSPLPKIIIVAGQHGSEKSSVISTLYFVRDLVQNWGKSSALDYLRNNVEIIIIPVANPWGFDNVQYKNYNGVNLNRNYDYNFTPGDDPSAQSYGGASPFDQPETQAIRDVILSNKDALIVIDYHVNTGGVAVSYPAINWINLSKLDAYNMYLRKMIEVARAHVTCITNHFIDDYSLDTDGALCGNVTIGLNDAEGGVSTLKNWAESVIIPAVTFEGFDGFPGATSYAPEAEKAGSELIGNWLVRIVNTLLS